MNLSFARLLVPFLLAFVDCLRDMNPPSHGLKEYVLNKKYVYEKRLLALADSPKLNLTTTTSNISNLSIEEIQNEQFYYTIKLDVGGVNPQTFDILVDSSNEVTWIPSEKCRSCGKEIDLYKYKYPKNTPLKNQSIISGDLDLFIHNNTISGEVLTDTCRIHDTKNNLNIEVKKMDLLLVNDIGSNFNDYIYGKLSLSLKSRGEFNFLDTLKSQKLINRRLFAVAEEGIIGKLYIGDLPSHIQTNSSKYTTCNITNNLKWFTENERFLNGWVCEISHAYMGQRAGLTKIANNTETTQFMEISGFAFFNTGSFVIRIPDKFFKLIVENYLEFSIGKVCKLFETGNEKYYKCPKERVDFNAIDPISFIIDGWAYEIPSYYLFVISDDVWNYEFLIRSSKESDKIWQFGQPFFRQYFTVFDKDNNQVGFYGGKKLNFKKNIEKIKESNEKLNKEEEVKVVKEETKVVKKEEKVGKEEKGGSMGLLITIGALLVIGILVVVIVKSKGSANEDDKRPLTSANTSADAQII